MQKGTNDNIIFVGQQFNSLKYYNVVQLIARASALSEDLVVTSLITRVIECAIMAELKLLNCEEFSEFLEEQGAHEDIIVFFSSNRISGEAFLNLSEDDLKELLLVIGDRVYIRNLLRNARDKTSMV